MYKRQTAVIYPTGTMRFTKIDERKLRIFMRKIIRSVLVSRRVIQTKARLILD